MMVAATDHESKQTLEFDAALLAAAKRAMAKYPADARRILAGCGLVQADAVTDYTSLATGWYRVRSQTDPQTYDVTSGAETTCTCPDATYRQALCKHGYAVLLVRAARRERANPVTHLAYNLLTGEHGLCRTVSDGRLHFWPHGSSKRALVAKADLSIGPVMEPVA